MDRFPAACFSTILHNFSARSLRARRRSGLRATAHDAERGEGFLVVVEAAIIKCKGKRARKKSSEANFFVYLERTLLEVFLQSE